MSSIPSTSAPVASKRYRFLVILIGVIAGYFAGRLLEDRLGWHDIRMLTMPVGGLVAGVLARLALERFDESRRS